MDATGKATSSHRHHPFGFSFLSHHFQFSTSLSKLTTIIVLFLLSFIFHLTILLGRFCNLFLLLNLSVNSLTSKMSLCYTSNFISLNHQKSLSLTFSSDSPRFINLFSVKHRKPHHPIKFTAKRFKLFASLTPSPPTETAPSSYRSKSPKDVNVLVVGSTGYIGKYVVRELVKRGFNVTAIARERSGIRGSVDKDQTLNQLRGANVCFSDVTNLDAFEGSLNSLGNSFDVVVSCLASRNGGVKDSWKIDYEATRNSLVAGRKRGASHFVLLSAICVQKPLLEFQRAKLKFEDELMKLADEDGGFSYSIVRPTAFFKSLGGQVELVKDGKPYVMFGDGKLCACKPMSESDLASFIVDCVLSEDKVNKVLPIGGPGKALTPLEQGEMLFRLLGKEPKFLKVPIGIMDFAIGVLDFLVKVFPSLEDAAEFGKIGRYYAAESMLLLDPETGEYSAEKTPSYGNDTLEEFFARVLREGMAGQELGEQTIF